MACCCSNCKMPLGDGQTWSQTWHVGVVVCGIHVFQLLPSGVRKAKQKCCGDSRYRVGEPQELDAGREVQFSWLHLFLAEQLCLAYTIDGKAGGQMFLSSVFVLPLF